MSMDLTGITNKNEYYTNHYFSTVFEENTRATRPHGSSLRRSTEGCERMTDVFSVSSLEEYIKIVERFSPNFSLSRGQGSDLPLSQSSQPNQDRKLNSMSFTFMLII